MNVEDLPVAVIVLDADRVIVSANDACEPLFGMAGKDLVGLPVFEALRPRTTGGTDLLATGWHRSVALHSVTALAEQDIQIRAGDGRVVDVVVDGGYERNDDGSVRGATLLFRRRSRGARRPRSGVRIVAAVSHELRSPLTSVRGYTSLLLKRWNDIEDAERKVMLQQVDRDARRIGRMIGELLDIARLETGRLQLQRVQVDLAELVQRVIVTVQAGYPDLRITVRQSTLDAVAWADADKVEQVLVNLLENACKYASPVGIVVEFRVLSDLVEVSVSDVGEGIDPADIPSLFEQFSRRADGKPTGTGLGLWISRGLVEAHGGMLDATSEPGRGSTFRFTLPVPSSELPTGR